MLGRSEGGGEAVERDGLPAQGAGAEDEGQDDLQFSQSLVEGHPGAATYLYRLGTASGLAGLLRCPAEGSGRAPVCSLPPIAAGAVRAAGPGQGARSARMANTASLALCVSRQLVWVTFGFRVLRCPVKTAELL